MNKLFKSIGITKQAFHQHTNRYLKREEFKSQMVSLIQDIRLDHPTMGCRDMYHKIQPDYIGRDAFERFCKDEGLMSKRPINHQRTTDSSGVKRFKNHIENLKLTTLNQVWQSDISYFHVNGRFYYLTFILDAFSRKIVGHQVSTRLYTKDTTLAALKKAIKCRGGHIPEKLIFHSDGGGQYYSNEFLEFTNKYSMINSMCKYAWENGKAERINGVIKNNYLIHRQINSYDDLVKEVDRSVYLYNNHKPHISLKRKTPNQFELDYLCTKEKTKKTD